MALPANGRGGNLMASINPYDELGRILASGGDFALANLMFSGATTEEIDKWRLVRFPDGTDDQWRQLREIAEQTRIAGERQLLLEYSDDEKRDITPVNDRLFGDEPGGRRSKFSFDVVNPDGKAIWSGTIDFPDWPTGDELEAAIRDQLRDQSDASPKAWRKAGGGDVAETTIQIIGASRRF